MWGAVVVQVNYTNHPMLPLMKNRVVLARVEPQTESWPSGGPEPIACAQEQVWFMSAISPAMSHRSLLLELMLTNAA